MDVGTEGSLLSPIDHASLNFIPALRISVPNFLLTENFEDILV